MTGRGDATKALVTAAVSRILPEALLERSDTADAGGLALTGAAHLGLWEVGPARLKALEGCDMPAKR